MASALGRPSGCPAASVAENAGSWVRSEEHTSELQSQSNLVCRLLLEKKKKKDDYNVFSLKENDIDSLHAHYTLKHLHTNDSPSHRTIRYHLQPSDVSIAAISRPCIAD